MKKLVSVIAVVAIVFACSISMAKSDKDLASSMSSKMGYVDLNRALNEVKEGKAAKAKLESEGKAMKKKLEILQGDLQKMRDDLEKQRLILSANALREKESKFQQKFVELQKQSMEAEQKFAEKEANYIKPISDKLQRIISKIGQDEGYTMIVPREMALYSPAGSDITTKVIEMYNKSK